MNKNTVWACVSTVCKVTSAAHIRWIYSFFVIYIQCQFFSTPAPLVKCQHPEVILLRPRKFTCSLFKKETDMCTCPFIFLAPRLQTASTSPSFKGAVMVPRSSNYRAETLHLWTGLGRTGFMHLLNGANCKQLEKLNSSNSPRRSQSFITRCLFMTLCDRSY